MGWCTKFEKQELLQGMSVMKRFTVLSFCQFNVDCVVLRILSRNNIYKFMIIICVNYTFICDYMTGCVHISFLSISHPTLCIFIKGIVNGIIASEFVIKSEYMFCWQSTPHPVDISFNVLCIESAIEAQILVTFMIECDYSWVGYSDFEVTFVNTMRSLLWFLQNLSILWLPTVNKYVFGERICKKNGLLGTLASHQNFAHVPEFCPSVCSEICV